MEIPIYSKLEAYHKKGRISFAMPGHKNLRGLAPDLQKCDVTELPQTVDLHHQSQEVRRANELLAKYYGTKQSFIMTGGSTAGIQSMLCAVLSPGDTLLAAADCHMSVINTCAICGFKLRLAQVEFNSGMGVPCGLSKLHIPNDVSAVLVTSPNYYGITKDIAALAKQCHERGIPLLVDEAHGAHFKASDELPSSAVELGADMVCQSAHKTLNALTGAAYLHICSNTIDVNRVKKLLSAFQSSSPSYPIAASADAARATIEDINYSGIIRECSEFRDAIGSATAIAVLPNDDITRIVLNFAAYEISGFEVSKLLSEYFGIDTEMADLKNVVLIATPWNTRNDFMSLFSALNDIVRDCKKTESSAEFTLPRISGRDIDPSLGWYGSTEIVDLQGAAGRISAASVTAYPPGIPIIICGDIIEREQAEYIMNIQSMGADIAGLCGTGIEVIK